MEEKRISWEEFESKLKEKKREKYDLDKISPGTAIEFSNLSKGQIAALARKAKEKGLLFKASYKEGKILVGRPPE